MRNKIIFIFVPIIIVVAVLFFINKKEPAQITEQNTNVGETEVKENVAVSTETPKPTTPPTTKDIAWNLFQKYLSYNKDLNLNSVKSIVYKVSDLCNTAEPTKECKNRMNSAYSYGSVLDKESFTNVWSDEKQIILSTDFWLESSKDLDQYGRFRSIIFFIKGTDNKWRLLSFSPNQGGAANKGAASQEEVDARIIRYTEDKDKDGIADYEEECLNKPNDLSCIKTDPKVRDTDKDGLWDGVDTLMK